MTSLKLFTQWGLNIIELMPEAKEKVKFVIVVINYFTKWTELEPLSIITELKI